MQSVLQDWVMQMGLRHQACLLSIVRGCDSVGKEDVTKHLVRQIRGLFMVPHCGDINKSKTFMDVYDSNLFIEHFNKFAKNMDLYPFHYVMHLLHSIQIIGEYHPDDRIADHFRLYYRSLCRKMHVKPESKHDLDYRLNVDEDNFAANASCSNKEVPCR
jgi:hypothetical protein